MRIFRYVTERTFDGYSWQLIENKQKFISQIMTSKSPVRSCEDIDETTLSFAEVKALATGNPLIREKMDLDTQVTKLKVLQAEHNSQRYQLQDDISKRYPAQISSLKKTIKNLQSDLAQYQEHFSQTKDFSIKIGGILYTDKKSAGEALMEQLRNSSSNASVCIGEYMGFPMELSFNLSLLEFQINLHGKESHVVTIGTDGLGNLTRIQNAMKSISTDLEKEEEDLSKAEKNLANAKKEVEKPFPKQQELEEKLRRLTELNLRLNMDETGKKMEQISQEEKGGSEEEATSQRTVVALESTKDYSDPDLGFTDYQYADGEIAHRYRLVCVGENDKLDGYSGMPEAFFRNEYLAQQFLSEHAEELTVIPYEEMLGLAKEHSIVQEVHAVDHQPEKDFDVEFA